MIKMAWNVLFNPLKFSLSLCFQINVNFNPFNILKIQMQEMLFQKMSLYACNASLFRYCSDVSKIYKTLFSRKRDLFVNCCCLNSLGNFTTYFKLVFNYSRHCLKFRSWNSSTTFVLGSILFNCS